MRAALIALSLVRVTRRTSAVALVVMAATACELASDGFIPSEADVRRRFADVTGVAAMEVHPVYRYSDFDAMLAVVCPRPPHTLSELAQKARRWTIAEVRPDAVLLARQTASGYELVKLLRAREGCIAMAWLQADGVDAGSFHSSGEARFAREVVWPRLEEVALQQ